MRETFRHMVDGREVIVLDDCFPTEGVEAIARYAARAPFTAQGPLASGPSRGQPLHYTSPSEYEPEVAQYDASQMLDTFVGETVRDALGASLPGEAFEASRVTVSREKYGDLAATRADHAPVAKHVNVVVCANPYWNLDWGGEYLFYNKKGDCVAAVRHRPGRVIVYRSSIRARRMVPNRECYRPRYAVTFQFLATKAPGSRSRARASTARASTATRVASRRS